MDVSAVQHAREDGDSARDRVAAAAETAAAAWKDLAAVAAREDACSLLGPALLRCGNLAAILEEALAALAAETAAAAARELAAGALIAAGREIERAARHALRRVS